MCVGVWVCRIVDWGVAVGEVLILRREGLGATDERGHVTAWRQRRKPGSLQAGREDAGRSPRTAELLRSSTSKWTLTPALFPLDHPKSPTTTNDAAAGARTGLKEE